MGPGWWTLWLAVGAAMTLPATPAELCALAEVVVVAEVTSQETSWVPGTAGHLATRSWLHVDEVVRGEIAAPLSVVTAGGHLDGLTMTVEDEARLQLDRRYMLLLTRGPDAWRVVSGRQGAWPVPVGMPVDTLREACDAR